MDIHITDTIRDIDENEWQTLVGNDHPETLYCWYRTVEDSESRNVHYIFLRENGKVVAGACCFLFHERVFNVSFPLLEVRSPLGASSAFISRTPEHAGMIVKALDKIRRKEKAIAQSIFCLKKDEFERIRKQVKGFVGLPMNDNTYIDLHFTDFEDYLDSLSAKARRSVRITLNKAQKLHVKPLFTNEFSQWKAVAHRLQKYICEQYNDYRWLLHEAFYDAAEKHLKENAEIILFSKDDIPLAFGLSIMSPTIVQYKFVGVDPHYRDYQAYFLIYYEGIRKALERKQKRIYFGLKSYAFKEKIGCIREELFVLAKMGNPLLNRALQVYRNFSHLQKR